MAAGQVTTCELIHRSSDQRLVLLLTARFCSRLLCYPTCATFAILCFACQRAGLIMALANPAYTEEEMRHSATLVNAKLILTVTALKPAFAKAGISESALTDASSPPSKESGSRALYSNLVGSVQDAERILSKAGPKNVSWNDPCGIFFRFVCFRKRAPSRLFTPLAHLAAAPVPLACQRQSWCHIAT